MSDRPPCRIALVLVPGFSHLGLALATEPLFIANWLVQRPVFRWTTLSADGLAVPSSSGLSLPVDQPLSPSSPFDIALVVASFDSRAVAADARVIPWLRRAARAGVRVGGIETGCEIVAEAGLLEGVEVPLHWYNRAGVQERMPHLHPSRQRHTNDGDRPLSAGGIATLDLMLDLIARERGAALSRDVARHLLVAAPAPEGLAPPVTPGGALEPAGAQDCVALAHEVIASTLDDPLSVPALAARVGLSVRHLQRRFQARYGQTLRGARDDLRMAAAHQFVQQTDLPLTEVAVACGFASLAAFSRSYRARFGTAPSRDRRQTTDSTVFRARARGG